MHQRAYLILLGLPSAPDGAIFMPTSHGYTCYGGMLKLDEVDLKQLSGIIKLISTHDAERLIKENNLTPNQYAPNCPPCYKKK